MRPRSKCMVIVEGLPGPLLKMPFTVSQSSLGHACIYAILMKHELVTELPSHFVALGRSVNTMDRNTRRRRP
jgi:hypothetical protein